MNLGKLIKDLKVRTVSRIQAAKYGKIDYGIVKVAFMVAALDGDVSDDELAAIDALLKKCRGYSAKAAAKALEEAMRSAGYLLFWGRRAKDGALVRAFLAEAKAVLPNGFAFLPVDEIRRAIVTWMALGMSDGDYSARERKCLEALCMYFAEIKVDMAQEREQQWSIMTKSFGRDFGSAGSMATDMSISRDFVSRVESLVAQYGDRAEAAKELEKLIASV